jgi:hypothetical protein
MKILFVVAGVLAASAVHAQALERWSLPDPDEMVKASNVLCADQAKSALVAGALRAKGHRREEVLALLPEAPQSLSLRVVSAMRESVEDAFDFPKLSTYTQYSFRAEVCLRETLGAVRMPRLAAVSPQLEECQRIHGPEKSNGLFQCIRAVVRRAEPRGSP